MEKMLEIRNRWMSQACTISAALHKVTAHGAKSFERTPEDYKSINAYIDDRFAHALTYYSAAGYTQACMEAGKYVIENYEPEMDICATGKWAAAMYFKERQEYRHALEWLSMQIPDSYLTSSENAPVDRASIYMEQAEIYEKMNGKTAAAEIYLNMALQQTLNMPLQQSSILQVYQRMIDFYLACGKREDAVAVYLSYKKVALAGISVKNNYYAGSDMLQLALDSQKLSFSYHDYIISGMELQIEAMNTFAVESMERALVSLEGEQMSAYMLRDSLLGTEQILKKITKK